MFKLRAFRRSERGTIAVTFALLSVPMFMIAGSGIDLISAQSVHAELQQVADSATLAAAARMPVLNETEQQTEQALTGIVTAYYTANAVTSQGATLKDIDVSLDTANDEVEVQISAEVPLSFLPIAGLEKLDLSVSAAAKRARPGPLNLALVLDITESMKFYVSGKAKIDSMKEAATDLVDAIMVHEGVKVGVTPFLHYVNIGTRYSGKPWLNVPSPTSTNVCSYPNATGCGWGPGTCDGMPCQVYTCSNPGPLVCTTQTRNWTGCIGVRREQYHGSTADATSVRYSGFVNGWDTACGPSLLPLTSSIVQVKAAISGLYYVTAGQTYIPGGLLWGLNMLTPEEPMNEADTVANLEDKDGKRVMVLMTDGINTFSPQNRTGIFTALHANSVYGNGTYTDNLTSSLCTSIKQQGIIIYTVLFDVNDSAMQQRMRDCASDTGKAFNVSTSAELKNAFSAIGISLQKVRLTH
jgi:Flp pilus assembly protein TadG